MIALCFGRQMFDKVPFSLTSSWSVSYSSCEDQNVISLCTDFSKIRGENWNSLYFFFFKLESILILAICSKSQLCTRKVIANKTIDVSIDKIVILLPFKVTLQIADIALLKKKSFPKICID